MSWRNRLIVGDSLEVLGQMPDGIVQCCVTSPPYWGLRTYGVQAQLGLEKTPEEYIEKMVQVFREVRWVLRKDGTLWLNMGDSYAGSPPGNKPTWSTSGLHGAASSIQYQNTLHKSIGQVSDKRSSTLKPKDLCGIPWRLAFALQADGWWLRSDIVWAKPNPMPESVTDRPTKSHEYIFLLSKSKNYLYDQGAVREPQKDAHLISQNYGRLSENNKFSSKEGNRSVEYGTKWQPKKREYNPSGRNLRSVWTFATEPYPEAHFATFPRELARRCILAGTSPKGACPECGAPWERVVDRKYLSPIQTTGTENGRHTKGRNRNVVRMGDGVDSQTLGFRPTCSCNADSPIPCLVLDPFVGSGTTAEVAIDLDRDVIGIDLNEQYIKDFAQPRLDEAMKRRRAREQQEVLKL